MILVALGWIFSEDVRDGDAFNTGLTEPVAGKIDETVSENREKTKTVSGPALYGNVKAAKRLPGSVGL